MSTLHIAAGHEYEFTTDSGKESLGNFIITYVGKCWENVDEPYVEGIYTKETFDVSTQPMYQVVSYIQRGIFKLVGTGRDVADLGIDPAVLNILEINKRDRAEGNLPTHPASEEERNYLKDTWLGESV